MTAHTRYLKGHKILTDVRCVAAVKEMKDLQVFVSNQCPFEVHKQIEELGKPLVTTKWVVQCLVNGCRLSYTGHQDYMYQSQSDE